MPLLLLIPVIWLTWRVAKADQRRSFEHSPAFHESRALFNHELRQARLAAEMLEGVREAALKANVSALMQSTDEVVYALAHLAEPMDALTAQRFFNVLGADPQLRETGRMDSETRRAVVALQRAFSQEPHGRIDEETAIAIRYAAGVVAGQE